VTILLSIGAIAAVALLPILPTAKAILFWILLVFLNSGGIYLLPAFPRLSRVLFLLGALVFGLNLVLVGQLFPTRGPWYELPFVWGAGICAAACALRVKFLGLLSLLAIAIGYGGFWWDFVQHQWSAIVVPDLYSWSWQAGLHAPLLICLLFFPLAYRCHSRTIFTAAAIVFSLSLASNLAPIGWGVFGQHSLNGWSLAIALSLPSSLLWIYNDRAWSKKSFIPVARKISLGYLAVILYLSSFPWFWQGENFAREIPASVWWTCGSVSILLAITIRMWLKKWHKEKTIGLFNLTVAALAFWHRSIAPIPMLATIICNILLFLLTAIALRRGIRKRDYFAFRSATILVLSKSIPSLAFFSGSLALKAVMLILTVSGAIAAWIWFDLYHKSAE